MNEKSEGEARASFFFADKAKKFCCSVLIGFYRLRTIGRDTFASDAKDTFASDGRIPLHRMENVPLHRMQTTLCIGTFNHWSRTVLQMRYMPRQCSQPCPVLPLSEIL